jgi:eukaryotic-like serine/threonine-protein kinase
MEYVHGENLRHILESTLRKGWTIPIELAVMIVSSAAAGLHHAHERKGKNGQPLNIVHRDVSPANIMVGFDGSVKLLDFGIAKAEERSTKTQQGTIKGKYGYMSPEQCRGKPIDRRSDIFALGIILYEITTLRRAFRGNDDFDTMKRIVNGDLLPPSTAVPGYPRELEAIVLTAMARDPDYRFQTTQEMLEALDAFLQRAKLSGAPSAMARFMTQLFGSRREPWVDAAPRPSPSGGAGDHDDGGPALPDAGGDRTEINDPDAGADHDSLSVPTQDLAPNPTARDAATDSLSDTTAVVEREDAPEHDHGHGHGHAGVNQTVRDVDTRELEARTTRERTAPPHEQTTARNPTLDPATLPEPTAWVPPRPRPRDSDAAAWSQPSQPLPQEHASRRSGPIPSTPGEVMPRALSQPGMAAQGVPNRPTERGIGDAAARRSGQLVAPVGTPGGMRASSTSDAPLPGMHAQPQLPQPQPQPPQPQIPTTAELALAGDAVPSVRPSRAGMYILLAVLIAVIAVVAGSIALGMMNQSSRGTGTGAGSGSAAVAPGP